MTLVRHALLAFAAIALPGASVAQPGAHEEAQDPDNEIVVSAFPNNDIVVNGRARRCRPAAGDPLDSVSIPGWPEYMMIVPDGEGGFTVRRVTEQITGPEFWQRVGVNMGSFRFRTEAGDAPMCIGGRGGPFSFGGFRRIVDAAPYRGHRLRFTAWVATGDARQVSFWLASGLRLKRLYDGGNTNNVPFGGDHGWTPVLLETGPIDEEAEHISYGFNLQGSGNVWVYDPRLEIVDPSDGMRTDDLIVIGRD